MLTCRFYQVGGCIRDECLGIIPHDIDYAVEVPSYNEMKSELIRRGVRIFYEKPEHVTIRGHYNKQSCDYVMCKQSGSYRNDNQTSIMSGTIYDDLQRRDFTINAMAKDDNGNYLDPYNGLTDLKNQKLKLVNSLATILDDPLRMLRAIRFQVSLLGNFKPDSELELALQTPEVVNLLANVAHERIRDELEKAFRKDTNKTLLILTQYPLISNLIFSMNQNQIWLKPTVEKRKFNNR